MLFNFYMSFIKTDLMSTWKFVGLKNYLIVFKDPIFLKALVNNLIYILVLVTVGIGSSLIISVMIYRTSGILKKIYIFMFFAPVVTSMVAASLIWKLLYYPNVGIFAKIIYAIFHINPPLFLADPKIALLSIIFMDIWKDTGLRVVVLHAGMEDIPEHIYDASKVDGASAFTTFFKITLPLLRPQIIFLVAIYSINALRVFTQVYMMTGNPPGGPGNSTQVLVLKMYQEAFYATKFGNGAVIAMIVFILLLGLVILELKSFSQKWEY